jgi:hypothetical protein
MSEAEIKREIEKCDFQLRLIYVIVPASIFSIFVYADIIDDRVSWFKSCSLETYLSITAEVLSAVLGLAIPLALTVIQIIQTRMKTTKLTRVFISEHVYWMQIILLFLNIAVMALVALTNIPYFWIFCVFVFFASMVCLVRFILLVHRYVADLETHLAEKFDKDIDRFFK